jgi:hypothetical protein
MIAIFWNFAGYVGKIEGVSTCVVPVCVKFAFNLRVTSLWRHRSGTCFMWSFVVFQKWDTGVIKQTLLDLLSASWFLRANIGSYNMREKFFSFEVKWKLSNPTIFSVTSNKNLTQTRAVTFKNEVSRQIYRRKGSPLNSFMSWISKFGKEIFHTSPDRPCGPSSLL